MMHNSPLLFMQVGEPRLNHPTHFAEIPSMVWMMHEACISQPCGSKSGEMRAAACAWGWGGEGGGIRIQWANF